MSLENTIKDNKIKNKMSLLGKALSTAGIVYLGLFGGACKTNNTVEPEPVKPAIQITGTVYNETTGERGIPNVTLEVEANDTLYITAKGEVDPSQSNGFNWFGVQVLENGEVVDGVVTEGGIDYTDNQVKDLVEMKGKYEINEYYKGRTYNFAVTYDIQGNTTEGLKYVPFGPTIHQNPEKDYSWGTEKNQKIYDNREAIAEILDRNARYHGEDKDKDFFLNTIKFVYNPTNPRVTETRLEDIANVFKIIAGNQAAFTDISEKDAYDLRKIIE